MKKTHLFNTLVLATLTLFSIFGSNATNLSKKYIGNESGLQAIEYLKKIKDTALGTNNNYNLQDFKKLCMDSISKVNNFLTNDLQINLKAKKYRPLLLLGGCFLTTLIIYSIVKRMLSLILFVSIFTGLVLIGSRIATTKAV